MYRRYSLLNSENHLPWWFRCPPLTDFQVPTLQILCDVAKVLNEGGITSCSSRQIFYTWLLKHSNLSCDFTCLLFLQLQPGGIKVISSNVSKRPFPKNRLCSKSSNYVHLYLQCYTLVIVEILNRSLQERKEKKGKKNFFSRCLFLGYMLDFRSKYLWDFYAVKKLSVLPHEISRCYKVHESNC